MQEAMAAANNNKDSGRTAYDAMARFFHWTIVVFILLLIPIGLIMSDLDPGPLQDTLFVTHESLGLTVFILALLRLVWRLSHPPPPPSRDLTRLEIIGSTAVHWLLYALILAMPVSGYLFVVAGDFPLTYFGLADAPRLVAKSKALSDLAETTHLTLQYAIYALALMHAGAALHHYFFRRNDVLYRMLPSLRR